MRTATKHSGERDPETPGRDARRGSYLRSLPREGAPAAASAALVGPAQTQPGTIGQPTQFGPGSADALFSANAAGASRTRLPATSSRPALDLLKQNGPLATLLWLGTKVTNKHVQPLCAATSERLSNPHGHGPRPARQDHLRRDDGRVAPIAAGCKPRFPLVARGS